MNEWEWQLLEEQTPVDRLTIGGWEVRVGDRVRLNPRAGGDILDVALRGQAATVESIQQDYEGKNHVCVVLDEDPGRDLGLMRQPGHRFFFDAEEIRPLPAEEQKSQGLGARGPRVLVAGIGNIFLGDDGFGVEVVKRLADHKFPEGVRVVDFGIRGFDLAYALQDGYDTTILVDAYPHGRKPGTVSLVEPDLERLQEAPDGMVETHGMNPLRVLRMAAAMNGGRKKVLLVGCEPETLGGDEGQMGLSEAVEAAVDEAVKLLVATINKVVSEQ